MIICCGEALIDMIPVQKDGETAFLPKSGGAIFNTAIACGRLGIDTGFITGLSRDLFGKQLEQTLAASKVNTDLAMRSDYPATLAFVELNNGQASYTFYDENTAGRMLDPDNLPVIPDDIDALYFGGISLISEPAADFYAALAVRESKQRVIMIDPNIRTSFITDEARYRARLDKIVAHADILKVSDDDLEWIIAGDLSLDEKVQKVSAMGPEIVLLTRGSQGASAYRNGEKVAAAAAQLVEVVDTVGAGDTFNAGVIAKLADSGVLKKTELANISPQQLTEALELGARVAAVTVSRAGANPPWADELV